jgi:hypothetical protein
MVRAIDEKVLNERIIPQIPVGRLGEPEEIARCVVFLAADDAGSSPDRRSAPTAASSSSDRQAHRGPDGPFPFSGRSRRKNLRRFLPNSFEGIWSDRGRRGAVFVGPFPFAGRPIQEARGKNLRRFLPNSFEGIWGAHDTRHCHGHRLQRDRPHGPRWPLLTIGSAPVPPLLLNAVCFAIGGGIGLVWRRARGMAGAARRASWGLGLGHWGLFGYHACTSPPSAWPRRPKPG